MARRQTRLGVEGGSRDQAMSATPGCPWCESSVYRDDPKLCHRTSELGHYDWFQNPAGRPEGVPHKRGLNHL